VRVLQASADSVVCVFSDGSVTSLDLAAQAHTVIATLPMAVTAAHVVDSGALKSFVADLQGQVHLVRTDLSSGAVSTPLLVQPIGRELGAATPINCFMVQETTNSSAQLAIIMAGEFDTIGWVNETTGAQAAIVPNLADMGAGIAEFTCDLGTKDCDFWTTSAFDAASPTPALYFQAHAVDDSTGVTTTAMYKLNWLLNKVTGEYNPYTDAMKLPMSFGFAGYQSVAFV
jgi:hypothetical protein